MDDNISSSSQMAADYVQHDTPISLGAQVDALLWHPEVIRLVQGYWSSDEVSTP